MIIEIDVKIGKAMEVMQDPRLNGEIFPQFGDTIIPSHRKILMYLFFQQLKEILPEKQWKDVTQINYKIDRNNDRYRFTAVISDKLIEEEGNSMNKLLCIGAEYTFTNKTISSEVFTAKVRDLYGAPSTDRAELEITNKVLITDRKTVGPGNRFYIPLSSYNWEVLLTKISHKPGTPPPPPPGPKPPAEIVREDRNLKQPLPDGMKVVDSITTSGIENSPGLEPHMEDQDYPQGSDMYFIQLVGREDGLYTPQDRAFLKDRLEQYKKIVTLLEKKLGL